MRTLAIGDIHGCLRALDLLLEMVRPQPDDVLITLGDYVDRGPDSKGVIERLLELQGRCQLIPLKGNHELMMLDAANSPGAYFGWLQCCGTQCPESYGPNLDWKAFVVSVPREQWQFLTTCNHLHETDTHFFVHANAHFEIPLAEQPDHMLFWESLSPSWHRRHQSGKTMICGHTQQRSGKPLVLDGAVCIDTWAYGDGWLTCLDVASGQYWQANQKGKRDLRTDWLEEYESRLDNA